MELDNIVDLYIRVSSTEQAEEGYSLGEQETRLRSYCEAYGYTIHAVHIDPGFSGATLERPGIKKVIEDVETGKVRKVVVWKLDRLSRSQKDTLILLEDVFIANNCSFVSIMESFDTSTPVGKFVVGLLAAFAQMERENIKVRTMMGRQARIREGHFHGSHPPFGYKFVQGSNDIVPEPYAAKLVKEIYKRFISGESISSISKVMAQTYGTSLYDFSHNTAIRRILSNPVYMGKVKSAGVLYDGIHEALVSETDYYLAQALLIHNKELDKRSYSFKTASGKVADNLLTGLLFCGDCGARMYARKVSSAKKKYICHSVARTSAAMIKSDNCTNRVHPFTVQQLDNIVVEEIKRLALDKSYFEEMIEEYQEESPEELEAINERLSEIEKQINRLLNLYQTGIIELSDIQARLGTLQEEKERLTTQLSIEKPSPKCSRDIAWDRISSFPEIIENGNLEDAHRIIHSLIDKIVVLNEDVTIYWSFC